MAQLEAEEDKAEKEREKKRLKKKQQQLKKLAEKQGLTVEQLEESIKRKQE